MATNVKAAIKDGVLVLSVNLKVKGELSASKKSFVKAKTGGNVQLNELIDDCPKEYRKFRVNVNVFEPKSGDKSTDDE